MVVKPISFKNQAGLILRGYVHIPKRYPKKHATAIVYLHGFPGSMTGSAAKLLNLFSKLGFLCLRFDFGGSNTSEGKFEDKLMSKEVKDIKSAIDFLKQNYSFSELILIGISTGAIDAALYAHTDRRVSKVVLLSGVSDLKHAAHYDFNDEQVRDFWQKGYIRYYSPGHWVHRKKLKKAFYDEFFTLNLPKAIQQYCRPILIMHGSKDEAVPEFNAHELYRMANRLKKLVIVKGADHRFSKLRWRARVIWEVYRFIKKG